METTSPVLDQALAMARAGMSVIPISDRHTKTPPFSWKQYQNQAATEQQIRQWYTTNPRWGVGVITGPVSGNLTMIELEGRAAHLIPTITRTFQDNGHEQLWARLITGWSETTPSGGYHYYYRTPHEPEKNTKLASQPTPEAEQEPGKLNLQTLIETRGNGGLSVTAPTPAYCHPLNKPWTAITGGPATVPVFTREEETIIWDTLKSFNTAPEREHATTNNNSSVLRPVTIEGDTPGNDFEKNTSWEDILRPHGWTIDHISGQTTYWRRPGKDEGVSATTGHADDRDRLWVFSTSTEFQAEESYTKFAAYALLNHAGDMHTAAKQLAQDGYGSSVEFDIPVTARNNSNVIQLPARKQDNTTEQTVASTQTGNLAVFPVPESINVKGYQLTEEWNAQRLIQFHGHKIRYVQDRGRWLAWNGHKWEVCPRNGGIVRQLAKRTLTQDMNLDDNGGALSKWVKQSLKASGITNMLTQAETDERIAINQADLDTNPYVLNTPAGAVDLKTGQLQTPDPALLCTRATSVAPAPNTPTPKWDAFLADTFAGHPGLVDYIQTLAGYSATGTTGHHVLPFMYGAGANGKSVFLDVLAALLGDYATSTPANFLMQGKDEHLTEIAKLQGVRLAVGSEVNENAKFDEAKVKLLTGGDQLTARFMRGDYFDFTPTHHLWIAGNNLPRVEAGGYSFWRRLRTIPFTNQVPEGKRVENLADQLIQEEGAGILAWIIQGATRYLSSGIGEEPADVLNATSEYATQEDHLGRFIKDRVKVGGGDAIRVPYKEMRHAYTTWCSLEGQKPMPAVAFGRAVKTSHDINTIKSHGTRFYTNCMLLEESEDNDPWDDLGGLKQ